MDLTLGMKCDRCLKAVPEKISLHFERQVANQLLMILHSVNYTYQIQVCQAIFTLIGPALPLMQQHLRYPARNSRGINRQAPNRLLQCCPTLQREVRNIRWWIKQQRQRRLPMKNIRTYCWTVICRPMPRCCFLLFRFLSLHLDPENNFQKNNILKLIHFFPVLLANFRDLLFLSVYNIHKVVLLTPMNDLGYSANDLMNVSFVFIVEGKQDRARLPLLLKHYYGELYDEKGNLKRVAIISTNSCTNIKTYANLKYINQHLVFLRKSI